jgi:hypothetical protein
MLFACKGNNKTEQKRAFAPQMRVYHAGFSLFFVFFTK